MALTVLGALLIAGFTGWLTAFTTNRRLDKQLAHDREIKDLELAHDRELKDVEELRRLLDEAAGLVADAMYQVADISVSGVEGNPEEKIIQARKAMAALVQTSIQANHMEQRIALLLGLDHEVTQAFMHAHAVMGDLLESVRNIPLPIVRWKRSTTRGMNRAPLRFAFSKRRGDSSVANSTGIKTQRGFVRRVLRRPEFLRVPETSTAHCAAQKRRAMDYCFAWKAAV